ncbi:MAG: universal stress protein [Thermodesulfobacteriota bacterium]
MREIKRILWPTDLSENSARALPLVTSLSQKYGAEVHLLFVADDISQVVNFYGEDHPAPVEEFHHWMMSKSQERMERLCQSQLGGCPLYRKKIVVGDPAQEILRYVEENDIDLVVMATHGHGWSTHQHRHGQLPFGSVSEEVVKHCPVPVLTVAPPRGDG